MKKRGGIFRILDEVLAPEEYGVGFLLGNTELRDKVQKALEEMAADGTMAKISKNGLMKILPYLVNRSLK